MDNSQKLQLLSLCTGYGGIERGLELAGVEFRTVAHVEIEAYAVANLVAKMEEGKMVPAPIWTNLKTLPLEPFRGKIDLLTGGYPCQPFSIAGRRKGEQDPRHLFPYIEKIIESIKPAVCFFENVEGHLSQGFDYVQASLRDLGYSVEAGLFSAAEVGASHNRKRLFVLGYAEHLRPPSTEEQGSDGEAVCNDKKGPNQAGKLKGTSSTEILEHAHGQRLSRRWRHAFSSEKEFKYNSRSETFPSPQGSKPRDWENARLKPRLGRADDGYPHKVDRLRLLGNGVVPQTSCKAWKVLTSKILSQGIYE